MIIDDDGGGAVEPASGDTKDLRPVNGGVLVEGVGVDSGVVFIPECGANGVLRPGPYHFLGMSPWFL